MGKPKEIDLQAVKPSARKRTALARDSATRTRKTQQFNNASTLLHTENAGLLQPETEVEATHKVRQTDILPHVDPSTATKARFELDYHNTNLTPYDTVNFSRSSRCLLVTSRRGHVSLCMWREDRVKTELHLNETVRDATWLHNDNLFALAQKQCAYMYDASGAQVHALRTHHEPGKIQCLPHHLLLATTSAPSATHKRLMYTDISTGDVNAELDFGVRNLKLGHVNDLTTNLSNGILCSAHASGVVSMWSPISPRPLARVFAHAGGVRKVAVNASGRFMVTCGGDARVKIWDLRTYKTIDEWKAPALTSALAVSQRDLVALSFGATVQMWAPSGGSGSKNGGKWSGKPYMLETFSGSRMTALDFCGYEDVLGVCHEQGLRTMLVPGAGEPTFDSRAPNPYETRKQRRENEVRSLLDKLPANTIVLDPSAVGGIDKDPAERLKEVKERAFKANEGKRRKALDKNRKKGRNKISKRVKRIQANVVDAKSQELREKLEAHKRDADRARKLREAETEAVREGTRAGELEDILPQALNRFVRKA